MKWDEEQLTLFELLATSLGVDARWTPSIAKGRTGPRLTDEYIPIEEQDDPDQLGFDDWDENWAENLKERYGIAKPFAD